MEFKLSCSAEHSENYVGSRHSEDTHPSAHQARTSQSDRTASVRHSSIQSPSHPTTQNASASQNPSSAPSNSQTPPPLQHVHSTTAVTEDALTSVPDTSHAAEAAQGPSTGDGEDSDDDEAESYTFVAPKSMIDNMRLPSWFPSARRLCTQH